MATYEGLKSLLDYFERLQEILNIPESLEPDWRVQFEENRAVGAWCRVPEPTGPNPRIGDKQGFLLFMKATEKTLILNLKNASVLGGGEFKLVLTGDGPEALAEQLASVLGDLNLNGQIDIRTYIGRDDGEYLIDIDIQVEYHHW